MSTRCSRCDGQGYHHWVGGSFSVCEKCEGSGKPMGDAPPIVREMMRVIDDLRGQVNEKATENGRQYRNRQPPLPGLRCGSCRGNGFNPDDSPNRWGITKCRKCNGTGEMGGVNPIIERLWYEIDRLNQRIREIHFESTVRDRGIGRSNVSAKEDEVSITDIDVWRHILGVDPDDDVASVKRAYKQKVQKTHPDHGGNDLDFRMVKMAYDKLMEGLPR